MSYVGYLLTASEVFKLAQRVSGDRTVGTFASRSLRLIYMNYTIKDAYAIR